MENYFRYLACRTSVCKFLMTLVPSSPHNGPASCHTPSQPTQCPDGENRGGPPSHEVSSSSGASPDPGSGLHPHLPCHPVAGEARHSNQGGDGGLHQSLLRVPVQQGSHDPRGERWSWKKGGVKQARRYIKFIMIMRRTFSRWSSTDLRHCVYSCQR